MRYRVLVALLASCGGAAAPAAPVITMTAPAVTVSASPPVTASASPTAPPSIVASAEGIRFAGGDGTSIATAIAILGAHGEADGTTAEYSYLANVYGPQGSAWTMDRQSLLNASGKSYDALLITLAYGTKKTIYFDISDFFGKL